jgi:hypothetical protein
VLPQHIVVVSCTPLLLPLPLLLLLVLLLLLPLVLLLFHVLLISHLSLQLLVVQTWAPAVLQLERGRLL